MHPAGGSISILLVHQQNIGKGCDVDVRGAEFERLHKPISTIFDSFCASMEKQLLTREQRQMVDPERSKKAQKTANEDLAAKK